MFNVGGGEMFAIFLLALLILGPERLPKAMGQVGQYVAQMRRMSSGFQDEIRRAMDPDDAPFRPGEERIYPPAPAAEPTIDEVKVVNALDTTATESDDDAPETSEEVAEAEELVAQDGGAVDATAPEVQLPDDDDVPMTGTDGPTS